MQLVLKRDSIDKPLTFDIGLIQVFIPVCSPNACKGVLIASAAVTTTLGLEGYENYSLAGYQHHSQALLPSACIY